MNKKNRCILGICSIILFVMLDQFTKYLASTYLKGGNSISLIKGVFQLHYLENRGAAFGLMQGMKVWFVIGTVLMLGIIFAFSDGEKISWCKIYYDIVGFWRFWQFD